MIFNASKYIPIVKAIVLFSVLFIALYSILEDVPLRTNTDNTKGNEPLVIKRIHIDNYKNIIKISCFFPNKDKKPIPEFKKEMIQVTLRNQEQVFDDVYIKTVEKKAKNIIILTLQPPLKDAFYGIEKRNFTVQVTRDNTVVKNTKTAVLGTAVQLFDLRSYTASTLSKQLINSIPLVIIFTVLLIVIATVGMKYRFKKNHIKKYQKISNDTEEELDPFTFESIEENDDIVVVNHHIMLLKSWKKLKGLRSEKRVEELEFFFNEDGNSNIFKPQNKTTQKINRIWFGMIGGYLGWLLYMVLLRFDFREYREVLSSLFDNSSQQFSSVLYHDSILALVLGLGIGIAFSVADQYYGNRKHSLFILVLQSVFRTILLLLFFLLQFLINIYIIDDSIYASLIAWLCIGTALMISFTPSASIKKEIIGSIVVGFVGFASYHFPKLYMNSIDVDSILLLSLLVTGSLSGWVTYTKPSGHQKMSRHENRIVENGNPLAIQIN